jgi:hypothetical protein
MKSKITLFFCLLFSQVLFGQEKLIGKYEQRFFTNEGFGQISTIDFFSKDSFLMKKFNNQICYRTTQFLKGKYIIKNDTIIFINTVPLNKFLSVKSKKLTNEQFVYSINHYVDTLLTSLLFSFIDKDFNIIETKPLNIERISDKLFSKSKSNFLRVKFNIPKNCLYFTAKYLTGEPTTFSLEQIKGKIIADKINNSGEKFDEMSIYVDEDEGILNTYTDISNDRYLLDKNRMTFSSLKKHYGPVGNLIIHTYQKK